MGSPDHFLERCSGEREKAKDVLETRRELTKPFRIHTYKQAREAYLTATGPSESARRGWP
jgi:hypothetical protein